MLPDGGLVLLLGINESGKTSVLLAIESFDYTNDPQDPGLQIKRYKQIRNKKEITGTSKAEITATIQIDSSDIENITEKLFGAGFLSNLKKKELITFLKGIKNLQISRIFIYENAEFKEVKYEIAEQGKTLLNHLKRGVVEDSICKSILALCPSIQYFEDFKDQIPEYICPQSGLENYSLDWVNTLEGLFYHTDKNLSIQKFVAIKDVNARDTLLRKINNQLNKQFTKRWNRLKGVKTIHEANLIYIPEKNLFTFQIVGADKSTVFSVEERSKGALWYLTFLLKTEFRKRKLRAESGKTLYLIDEPGSNLHSSAQTNMLEDFKTLASDSNVIYTTHSQYLIDTSNLANTYITEISGSVVRVLEYNQYLQGRSIKTSYFQPLLDAIKVRPFSLDIPWKKCLICEGTYDYVAYTMAFENVLGKKPEFLIIPGEGASDLSGLISIAISWGAKFITLLDNDDEGRVQAKRYADNFTVFGDRMLTLDKIVKIPKTNFEMEDLFEDKDKISLAGLVGIKIKTPLKKKAFDQILATIFLSVTLRKRVKTIISLKTNKNFQKMYSALTTNF